MLGEMTSTVWSLMLVTVCIDKDLLIPRETASTSVIREETSGDTNLEAYMTESQGRM